MGAAATITDAYVPAGATTFHVDDASKLAQGATVFVERPVTDAWVHFLGMDTLVRNGMPQTWIKAGSTIRTERIVSAIHGNAVTVDVPLSDSLDLAYVMPGATVVRYSFPTRIEQVGLEGVHVVAPAMTAPIDQATFFLLSMDAVIDGWVKDVAAEGFTNGMGIGGDSKRITVEDTSFLHTAPIDGSSGYPADFGIGGQQVLLSRCASTGDHVFSVVTQAEAPGPNVILAMKANGNPTNLAPHQRWATGLLVDGLVSPTGGVQLMNRGTAGSGQGWAMGFGVVWNATVSDLFVQAPPGAMNWAIGSTGTVTTTAPQGIVDSHGTAVAPKSLYLAQLCERLGKKAVANIGF
jgi:hypothetical protein